MMTNTAVGNAGQRAPGPQMGVVSVWAAVQSCLFSLPLLLRGGRSPLVCVSLAAPVAAAVQRCWCCSGTAGTAVLCSLRCILHSRFFGCSSSSRSGAWAIGLFLPDKLAGDFVVGFQGIRSSLIAVFFWTRSIQKCKAGFCEIGLLVLASLAVLEPFFRPASLLRCQRDSFSAVENAQKVERCWCVAVFSGRRVLDNGLAALFPKQPARQHGARNPTGTCQIICSGT